MAVIVGKGGLYVLKKSGVVQNALLMESGEFLITETGEYIIWD